MLSPHWSEPDGLPVALATAFFVCVRVCVKRTTHLRTVRGAHLRLGGAALKCNDICPLDVLSLTANVRGFRAKKTAIGVGDELLLRVEVVRADEATVTFATSTGSGTTVRLKIRQDNDYIVEVKKAAKEGRRRDGVLV